ncbi:MAG TPA: 4-alpha-glucanotransferase [Chloroflexota bacterium]|nr:4-alpha-glucanotransferase [Chloroflexota bacterium]
MILPRCSGVLLHVVSLPGGHGIGDLGHEAYRFVDWLAAAGQRMWQILPLGPTGYGNSPYASTSAFAGNPDLISLDRLADDGLLTHEELAHNLPRDRVDYGQTHAFKQQALKRACDRFTGSDEFEQFQQRSAYWLDDYVRVQSGGNPATERFECFCQYEFDRQWHALRSHANQRGVQIIGDVPIFVADGSVDVQAHPELFHVDVKGRPELVAGVPPDLFSQTGQRWGNPHYRWDVMARDGYAWWRDRLRRLLELVDIVRIDHFRGLAAYWAVPADAPTAETGEWVQGPGAGLFEEISRHLGDLPVVVEDLGLITSDVIKLKEQLSFPGMKVLQYAFDGSPDNPYLPHNYRRECIVYTGTHDNDTTVSWYELLPEAERGTVRRYLGQDGQDIAWKLIRLAHQSVARVALYPVQDLLSLGNDARFNFPGKRDGNWSWRLPQDSLTDQLAGRLHELTATYGRLPKPVEQREAEAVDGYPFGVAGINSGL